MNANVFRSVLALSPLLLTADQTMNEEELFSLEGRQEPLADSTNESTPLGQNVQSEEPKIRPAECLQGKALDRGCYVTGSILYWKNMQENLSYGLRQRPPSNTDAGSINAADVTIIGDIKTLEYDWDLGARATLGYRFGVLGWDLFAEYTYFHDTASGSDSRIPNGTVYPFDYLAPLAGNFVGQQNFYRMTSKAELLYNTADLMLQRPIYHSETVLFRFLFGGRGAWISQDWKSRYFTNADPDIPYQTVKNNWTFKGGGLRAGFNMEWFWWYGLGLRFQATAGLILGRFSNLHSNIETDLDAGFLAQNPDGEYIVGKVHPHSTRIIPTYQCLIGLQWRRPINCWAIRLYADWEINGLVDLNQTYQYPLRNYNESAVGSWSRDSVILQGLTAGISLEF